MSGFAGSRPALRWGPLKLPRYCWLCVGRGRPIEAVSAGISWIFTDLFLRWDFLEVGRVRGFLVPREEGGKGYGEGSKAGPFSVVDVDVGARQG